MSSEMRHLYMTDAWVELLRAEQFAHRFVTLEIFVNAIIQVVARQMGLSKIRVERFRGAYFLFGLPDQNGIVGFEINSEVGVAISKLRMRQSVTRVKGYRLFEQFNRFINRFSSIRAAPLLILLHPF